MTQHFELRIARFLFFLCLHAITCSAYVRVQGLTSRSCFRGQNCVVFDTALSARAKNAPDLLGASLPSPGKSFVVGENVPEEIMKQAAIYDMILVERYSAPERTSVGLILPKTEGKDQKHVGRVLSMGNYGLESENGRVQGPEEISPFQVGDDVYIRDPWGIGPKDQVIGDRCFSFHKAAHITGVIKKKSEKKIFF